MNNYDFLVVSFGKTQIFSLLRCCILGPPMIWFFDKDGEKLRYEITHDRVGGRYRVVITRPDGTESIEEVDEPTELIERSVQLMNSLRGDGWKVA